MRCFGRWMLVLGLVACGGDEEKDGKKDKDAGDDTATPEVTDEDGDGSPAEEDCDDSDPHLYPGAPELCDQRANDCDTMDDWSETDEAGTAMFTDSDGNMSDFTDLIAGAEDAPASLTLDQAGQIDLCEGTFYAALEISADLDLKPHGDVVLSGAGEATILAVLAEDITVTVSGLTLQDGLATIVSDISSEYRGAAGGAINVDVDATVELQSVVLKDNSGQWAGALFAGNGALIKGLDITTEGNFSSSGSSIAAAHLAAVQMWNLTSAETGGIGIFAHEAVISLSGAEMHNQAIAVYALGSNVDISQSNFSGNEKGLAFGISDSYYCNAEVSESSFSSNETAILQSGGLLAVSDSDFIGNSGDDIPGVHTEGVDLTVTDSRFIDNVSTETWSALFHFSGSAEISGCEFTGNQSTDPQPPVYLYAGDDVGDDVTVTDTSFSDNQGGAMEAGNANIIDLTNLTFTGNSGGQTLSINGSPSVSASSLVFEGNDGTAIHLHDAHGEISGVSISEQSAEYYTALHLLWGSDMSVDDIDISTLSGSSAAIAVDSASSVGIYDASSLQLSNATVSGGATDGIWVAGHVVLNNVTIDGTPRNGVYVWDDGATFSSTDLTITNAGGSCFFMMSASEGIMLVDTLLDTCADTGIKLYSAGGLSAAGLVLRNSFGDYVGGIYMAEDAFMSLSDSTIEGNSTEGSLYAGGVALAGDGARMVLGNVDFIDNLKEGAPADLWHGAGAVEVLGLSYSGTCEKDVGCETEE